MAHFRGITIQGCLNHFMVLYVSLSSDCNEVIVIPTHSGRGTAWFQGVWTPKLYVVRKTISPLSSVCILIKIAVCNLCMVLNAHSEGFYNRTNIKLCRSDGVCAHLDQPEKSVFLQNYCDHLAIPQ